MSIGVVLTQTRPRSRVAVALQSNLRYEHVFSLTLARAIVQTILTFPSESLHWREGGLTRTIPGDKVIEILSRYRRVDSFRSMLFSDTLIYNGPPLNSIAMYYCYCPVLCTMYKRSILPIARENISINRRTHNANEKITDIKTSCRGEKERKRERGICSNCYQHRHGRFLII